jgi:hypothetical protein
MPLKRYGENLMIGKLKEKTDAIALPVQSEQREFCNFKLSTAKKCKSLFVGFRKSLIEAIPT